MPYLNLDDCQIYFEIYGNELDLSKDEIRVKPTLICLHGGTGQFDHCYETYFYKKLQNDCQVIFMDYRGLGKSSLSAIDKLNPTQWAKDIYQFANLLGLEKPFLSGDSVGGHVAMLAGLQNPGFFGGLILVNTETKLDREEIIAAFKEKGGEDIGKIAHKVLYDPKPEDVDLYLNYCLPLCTKNPIPEEVFKHCNRVNEDCISHYNQNILYNLDLTQKVKDISDPVLYLASTENPFHNLAAAKRSIEAFDPNVLDSKMIENTGLLQIDAPELLKSHIIQFVQKHYD